MNPPGPKNLYTLPAAGAEMQEIAWTALCAGGALLLLSLWAATQYVAHQLSDQRALDPPLYVVAGYRLYAPTQIVVWWWAYYRHAEAKPVFDRAAYIVIAGSCLSVTVAAVIAWRRSRRLDARTDLHGSAHWATPREVRRTGLLGGNGGVYVGAWRHPRSGRVHYLRHDGPEHILAFAPTRSGKGVGLVLPTLLSWPHSVLVHDIKGENWALSAGWRREGLKSLCLKFDPAAADGSSVRFNPLEEVRVGTDLEVKDVQNIATMIVDPDGRGLNDHWAKTGHALLVGTILHVLYAEHNKTLHGVASFLSDPTRNIEQTIEAMLQTAHDAEGTRHWHDSTGRPTRTHPVVAEAARELLNKSENERSGVLSTAMSFLGLYRDPVVARNTAASEFKIRDLMHAERPVSLYLIVAPSDKDRLKPLVRLIVNQVVRSLTERMSFLDGRSVAGYRHRLLLMIDEFPALGRLEVFQEALAYIAGYGLKAYLITQDLSQLYAAYGREESIVSNCHVRVAFAPNKIETGELLSKMAGVMTVHRTTRSYSGHRLSPALTQMTAARQETARNLLTPDEAMRLPGLRFENGRAVAGDEIVFVAGHSPIYGQQILYFQDPVFSVRAKIAPPYVSDKVRVTAHVSDGMNTPQASIASSRDTSAREEMVEPSSETDIDPSEMVLDELEIEEADLPNHASGESEGLNDESPVTNTPSLRDRQNDKERIRRMI